MNEKPQSQDCKSHAESDVHPGQLLQPFSHHTKKHPKQVPKEPALKPIGTDQQQLCSGTD